MNNALTILFQIVVIIFSVVIHEVSHGLMAYSMGDDTAKRANRLTLNPIPHLDIFGSILLPLITVILGGFIFGYAKPVPYNPLNLDDRKYGPVKVAVAGPLSNLTVAVIFGLILRFVPAGFVSPIFLDLLGFIVMINIVLAVFNLLPIPPLDGHWFLLTFLPDRFYEFKRILVQYGMFFLLIFIFFLFPIILPVVTFLFQLITGSDLLI